MCVGETQLAKPLELTALGADTQLRTVALPRDQQAECSRAFSVKFNQLMRGVCGRDLRASRRYKETAG